MAGDGDGGNSGSGSGSGTGDGTVIEVIQRIPFKLPSFWKVDVRLWFCQIEALFASYNVIGSKSKYYHIVSSVDTDVLAQISDLIVNIPEDNPYDKLKERLISTYAVSDQARIQKLLTQLTLGDKRPSHLLQEMRSLGGTTVNAEFLKELWTQRLPVQCQLILKASDADLDGLAKLADQINEVYNVSGSVMSLSASTSSNNQHAEPLIQQQISELTKRFDAFMNKRSRSRGRSNNDNNNAGGKVCRSPTPAKSDSANKQGRDLCWYHWRFGDKATRCRGDCKFESKNN